MRILLLGLAFGVDANADTASLYTSEPSASACTGSTAIKINEFVANPDGVDSGREWVELHNTGSDSVDLSGWTFENGSSSYSRSVAIEGWALDVGGFLVIGGTDVSEAHIVVDTLNLGNGTSNSDAIRLIDCLGAVADTVIYGEPNSDGWVDDSGAIATSLAPTPDDDEALARGAGATDSDLCGVDFVIAIEPTPGAANLTGSVSSGDSGSGPTFCEAGDGSIKINELMPNPDGTDDGSEWLELYNAGTDDVDISDWIIESGTSDFSQTALIDGSVIVPAGGFTVLGGPLSTVADHTIDVYLGNASSGSDAVRLIDCGGTVQDTVVYGSGNPEEWLDDTDEIASSWADVPVSGYTLARIEDGLDTDQSGDDFAVADTPTPGARNEVGSGSSTDCTAGSQTIKINEILPNPEGADAGYEFVELFNPGSDRVDLSGWGIATATSTWRDDPDFVLPEGTTIASHAFLVIGSSFVDGVDILDDGALSLGNGSTAPDGVRLLDCEGTVEDTVLYGDAEDEPEDDLEDDAGNQSMGVMPGEALTLGRYPDGVDTDDCAADFYTDMAPTPGAANTTSDTTIDCEPGAMSMKINEFLPNPESTDDNREFVELVNTSSATVSLEGWGIRAATREFDEYFDFTFPAGATAPPGAFVVIAGLDIDEADFYIEDGNSFALGNASTAPDGIQLADCEGTTQDTVLYGDRGAAVEDLSLTDDRGVISMAIMPREGLTAGRYPDGIDTDDCSVDFTSNMSPTPGAPNSDTGADTGDDDDEDFGKGGCSCHSAAALGDNLLGIGLIAYLGLIGWRRQRPNGPGGPSASAR